MDFSVNDFLIIVERRSINTWKKTDAGSYVLYKFVLGSEKISVTADISSFEDDIWRIEVKPSNRNQIDADDEFFNKIDGIIADFLKSKSPDLVTISFRGKINASIPQSVSLKRSIEKLGYTVITSTHPDRFSINITKNKG